MRVIAGTARGKNLQALPGEDITRPTINRVKEAMFSSVQFPNVEARLQAYQDYNKDKDRLEKELKNLKAELVKL